VRFADHARDVQQCFGGNTAFEEARAAEPGIGLDERDLHAHVGGHECGRIPAGPTAQHHQLSLHGNQFQISRVESAGVRMFEMYGAVEARAANSIEPPIIPAERRRKKVRFSAIRRQF